ncbi:NADH-quinone oxidoreductase subunit NuoE family protein [Candidatus Contubernalis alkaliaceticus]|uniref:NADH-quinone oxidoreductase subunit NuoE family protein n=1 Tax=Candidatus Contubernalis alkaliaceticus TaxID=338645 RepID=UPI001F4BD7F7|nr:NAD(P)H-dependent oxidoreductase subunit E [Candidatus Contubernalis alkalaceticus]UNC93120.1 NAD(P)H-dependent oxidoreductase subunit E [Candidatus Contubernalis alkalaceticus]
MKVDLTKIDQMIDKYSSEEDVPYISILQDINDEYRYLPEEALHRVSKKLAVSMSQLYSLATFYKCFSLVPKGKHEVQVCMGTACHVRGAPRILEKVCQGFKVSPGKTSEDGEFSLETVNCVGACALGPLVVMDGKYHGKLTLNKIGKLMGGYHEKEDN